jgi:tRNA A-37 threonylcarbamoyl transferase component Bud32
MPEQLQCPRCQGLVSGDAPEGLCPECLYLQAIEGPGVGPTPNGEQRSPSPAFVPPSPADLARRFPQLEILELIGQGGMGAVYKARQPKLDRLLALKILPPEVARDPTFAERFAREAKSLARLNHPNIITIFDFGETDGLFYFSMEFVDGKNVRQLMEANELSTSMALQIVPQVCEALRYAHDEGVVHRDIKPENILLDKKGRVKIADFGLAKIVGLSPTYLTLTGTHEVMGTLYYMAPEQMKHSHSVDHRADLYSLGVVFYEMLTGELPVGRFAPPSHKARVDGRLDSIVLRALSREPEHRYQDAADLKNDVEAVKSGEPNPAGEPKGVAAGFAQRGFFEGFAHGAEQAFRRMGQAGQPEAQSASPSPQVQHHWPSFRFVIPNVTWAGSKVKGEAFRNEDSLIFEFKVDHGFWKSEIKEVRIPLSEIMSISCRTGRKGRALIVIKPVHAGALAGLPVGKYGLGRLGVPKRDRIAAKQLVDSIVLPAGPIRLDWQGQSLPYPGIKAGWPSVRFTIPELNVWGAKATGEIYRNEDALIIEFQRQTWGGVSWSDLKEIRIPFSEIVSISCQTESWAHNPHLPKWMRGWGGTTQIVIKTIQPSSLGELPVSKKIGRGRLVVDWGSREAAQQLVDTIIRPSPASIGRPPVAERHPRDMVKALDPVVARKKLLIPAIGLFLAGFVALISSISLAITQGGIGLRENDAHKFVFAFLALPIAFGAVFLLLATVRMLRLQSYHIVIMAIVLALLPWSPGWILGLPFGIWALVVLCKPEVIAAYKGDRYGLSVPSIDPSAPPARKKGRVRAFMHSVGRYCFTRFSGRQPGSDDAGGGRALRQPATVDYTPEPGAAKIDPREQGK